MKTRTLKINKEFHIKKKTLLKMVIVGVLIFQQFRNT